MSVHKENLPSTLFNLCRAIEKKSGNEVIGCYCRYGWTKEEKVYVIPSTASVLYSVEVEPDSVQRCTCLCDERGEWIFEGDFVKYGNYVFEIVFECGSFALYDKEGEMITKVGGDNDHCISLMFLYQECCWTDNCASDLSIVKT